MCRTRTSSWLSLRARLLLIDKLNLYLLCKCVRYSGCLLLTVLIIFFLLFSQFFVRRRNKAKEKKSISESTSPNENRIRPHEVKIKVNDVFYILCELWSRIAFSEWSFVTAAIECWYCADVLLPISLPLPKVWMKIIVQKTIMYSHESLPWWDPNFESADY